MTDLAPHLSVYLLEHLPRNRGASRHTINSYAYSFQLLIGYAAKRLRVRPSEMQIEKLDAELILDFPEIVEPIREGRLCLTTVCEVQKVLTSEYWREVLPRFYGLSKRDAEALVAELQPAEVIPFRTVVTAVRAPASPTRPT